MMLATLRCGVALFWVACLQCDFGLPLVAGLNQLLASPVKDLRDELVDQLLVRLQARDCGAGPGCGGLHDGLGKVGHQFLATSFWPPVFWPRF